MVPVNELVVNKGKAFDVLKVSGVKSEDAVIFRYIEVVIEVIIGTLLISLDMNESKLSSLVAHSGVFSFYVISTQDLEAKTVWVPLG